MNEDINDRFPRTYYMTPASSDYTFVFESEYGPFLVNANNPDICIPIEFDEDGNVKLDKNKFYIDEMVMLLFIQKMKNHKKEKLKL